jgi:hypothetical protein
MRDIKKTGKELKAAADAGGDPSAVLNASSPAKATPAAKRTPSTRKRKATQVIKPEITDGDDDDLEGGSVSEFTPTKSAAKKPRVTKPKANTTTLSQRMPAQVAQPATAVAAAAVVNHTAPVAANPAPTQETASRMGSVPAMTQSYTNSPAEQQSIVNTPAAVQEGAFTYPADFVPHDEFKKHYEAARQAHGFDDGEEAFDGNFGMDDGEV